MTATLSIKRKNIWGECILLVALMILVLSVSVACDRAAWETPSALAAAPSEPVGADLPLPSPIVVDLTSSVPIDAASLKEQWGIEIWQVSVTGIGGMIDFRMRVLDETKAAPILKNINKAPVLVSEKTGVSSQLVTAEDGKLTPEVGKVYIFFYGNPDRQFQSGDLITIIFGDVRLEHYVLQ